MKPVSLPRLALASLALTLAFTPALADDAARVPGNRYVVVNQTQAPLTCRYRINSISGGGSGSLWQDASPIAAGAEFNRVAQAPGETVSLACNAADARDSVTVVPGKRYTASRTDDGKVVVTRARA